MKGKFAGIRSAFSHRNYAIYVSCNAVSLIGFWMQRLALGWLTWEVSKSEFWVGAVAFADIAPLIIVGPVFGVWADRLRRKKLAIILQTAMFLQSLVLFLLVIGDKLSIATLFFMALLEGIIQAAYQPVRLSIIPNLVDRKDIVSAAAFTAVVFNVARFIGPALAGLVMVRFGVEWAILINALSYLGILFGWYFIHPREQNRQIQTQALWKELNAGASYVLERQALFVLFILLTISALLLRPITYMLSAVVGAVFSGGPELLALYTSAIGVGAVLSGLRLSMDGKVEGMVRGLLVSSLLAVLSLICFISSTVPEVASFFLFIFGYCITLSAVAGQTLVQHKVADDMRGRVLSLWVAFTRGAPAFGVLFMGAIAQFIGLVITNLIAAGLATIVCLLAFRRSHILQQYFEYQQHRKEI
jgi:MFS family permease